MTDRETSAPSSETITSFIRTHPAPSNVHAQLLKLQTDLSGFEVIIKQRSNPSVIPFYENIKHLVQTLNDSIVNEATELKQLLDELGSKCNQCLADNIRLDDSNKCLRAKTRRQQRVIMNIWNDNDNSIDESIAKDVCLIVLASKKHVSSRFNCIREELQSNSDKAHSRVVALEAEVLEKQQMLAKSEFD